MNELEMTDIPWRNVGERIRGSRKLEFWKVFSM